MFLVHRKDIVPDGKRPVLLHGYGGFGFPMLPTFDAVPTVWVEQGGVFALANIRGGGEFGQVWHRAGMLENKQNVFDDFIAAGEWLIANNYTSPSKLALMGQSNGGLLMGAVLTQRPDLFRATLIDFPELDPIRSPKWTENNSPPSLLEWGNAEDPEQFKYLIKYSPYQNVRAGTRYPAVLITSGETDTRVPPQQALKMAALLQHASASKHPVLLPYDRKAGHTGGKPEAELVEQMAMQLAFLFWQLGTEVSD